MEKVASMMMEMTAVWRGRFFVEKIIPLRRDF